MDITFIIEDAVANPIKFTLDSEPSDVRANFDQRRYAQVKNATVDEGKFYNQMFEKSDVVRIEFYSNFPLNRVKVVDCKDIVYGALMFPSVAVQYRNKFYRSSCKFSSIDGKMFVYFSDSREYLDEDFTEEGDVTAFNGRLPNINAVPGDSIRYSLDGETFSGAIITAIVWNPILQAEGYLTDVDITLVNPVDGLVEISYDEKPANLYAQIISLASLPPGKYFIKREHGIQNYDVSFTSEPLDVAELHPQTLALEYRHDGVYNRPDLWSYIYLEDWKNTIRIPADFYKFTPAGEVEIDTNDFGVSRILRATPFRQIELTFHNMPSWLADKLQIALSHDVKIVNGYEYEIENFGQFETIDRLDLGNYVVNLRQKNDRSKKTDSFTQEITAAFVPAEHLEIPFEGGDYLSTFESNTPFEFHFVSVPGWIVPNKATFVNGDVISFAIIGVGPIGRSITLTAICEINGLTAEITFSQLAGPPPIEPEFIEVDKNTLSLSAASGSNDIVNVLASSNYDISETGFDFTVTIEDSGNRIRITTPSANLSSSDRVGVVRLYLLIDPLIFQEITVTQIAAPPPPPSLISVTPDWRAVPTRNSSVNFSVVTETGAQWQVMTSDVWIIASTAIRTGSGTFTATINAGEYYEMPRNGTITVVNILNPSNNLVIIIEQG